MLDFSTFSLLICSPDSQIASLPFRLNIMLILENTDNPILHLVFQTADFIRQLYQHQRIDIDVYHSPANSLRFFRAASMTISSVPVFNLLSICRSLIYSQIPGLATLPF